MDNKEKIKSYLAFASVSFFWGTTYAAIRIGVEVMPPCLFAGIRFLIAGLIMLPLLLLKGYALPKKAEMLPIAIVAIVLLAIATGLVVWAEQFVSSSLAALVITTIPIFVVIFEAFVPHGDKITPVKIFGILIGFAGIVILLWPDLHGVLENNFIKGIVAMVLAPIAWSAGSIYTKYHKFTTPPLVIAAMHMVIAGIALILFGSIQGEWASMSFNIKGWAALLYLVVFGSIIGYGSFIYALDKLSATLVSTFAYINPIVAVIIGWLFLNERLDKMTVLATLVIMLGIALVQKTNTTVRNSDHLSRIEIKAEPETLSCNE